MDTLIEEDTRYVTVLAHNFSGYDSYFAVEEYHRKMHHRIPFFLALQFSICAAVSNASRRVKFCENVGNI